MEEDTSIKQNKVSEDSKSNLCNQLEKGGS